MTFGKASALAIGFVGAVALGVAISPFVGRPAAPSDVRAVNIPLPDASRQPDAAPTARRSVRTPAGPVIMPSAPELHARLKPLLNKGADLTVAAQDFRSAEQFAAVAHAARNTDIPFMLLRHRVLTEGKSLAAAIAASRPEVDATREANRAVSEARSDLAALAG